MPKTKPGSPAWKTHENKCDLVDKSSMTNKSAMFLCSIIRRICPSPPTGGTQVSG